MYGLLALLPFHNLFRTYTAQEPWKGFQVLDYWQEGLLAVIIVAAGWQLRREIGLILKNWRKPRLLWQSLLLHEKVLLVFGALGFIYVFVAPKLVVGLSGLVEDFACFGVYLVARQAGRNWRQRQRQPNKPRPAPLTH